MNEQFPEPEIVESPERKIVALAGDFDMETRGEIPKLWAELWGREFEVENQVSLTPFGVSFGHGQGTNFRYGAGYEADPPANLPDGATVITLRAGTYAVFSRRAPISTLPALFDHIFQTWIPASDYALDEGAIFERYPADSGAEGDARLYEIWAPVKPR